MTVGTGSLDGIPVRQDPKTVPSVVLEHDGNPIFCRCLFIFESLQEVESKEKLFEVSIGGTLFGI